MKSVEVTAKIPDSIAKAIIKATKEMPSLRKGERNKFGGYDYVPIDDYLDILPKVAAKHGLGWVTREVECKAVGEKGNHLAYTFALDLFHEDGTFLPEYTKVTVVHPIQGAQTAGSALAYGEKMLARFTFKIVTGEQDADATDNSQRESLGGRQEARPETGGSTPRPRGMAPPMTRQEAVEKGMIPRKEEAPVAAPAPVVGGIAQGGVKVTENVDGIPLISQPKETDGWKHVAAVFTTFAPTCKTADELKGFWDANIETLDKMKTDDKVLYKKVKGLFQDLNSKFTAENEGVK